MHDDSQRAIEAIDRAVEEARRLEGTPIVLDPSYLAGIDRVERMPQNQPGTDKTWVVTLVKRSDAFIARAVRVR